MAGVRMTGLVSGLDTETLVEQLSQAYQTKIDNAQKDQTRAEWKKEAWAALNTKIMDFYKNALATFKSSSTYNAKIINGSLSGVKITAGSNAVNGSHKVQVKSTASSQMWTGHKINSETYSATSYTAATDTSKKISELCDKNGYSISNALNGSSLKVSYGDTEVNVNINIDENTTVDDLLSNINNQLDGTGLTASFAKGAITFTNTSAAEETDADTGEKTYSGGYAITVAASDSASAAALGLIYDESGKGVTISQLSDTSTTNSTTGTAFAYEQKVTEGSSVTSSTKLVDIGIAEGSVIKVNNTDIVVSRTTTLSSLATSMANAGINASYDANQGRFYLSAKETGTANGFTIDADAAVLGALGLDYSDDATGKIDATDAVLVYNGVEYTQSTNSFSINGLTIDVNSVGEEQGFTVDDDVDGIYDKVKNFVKEYNTLIAEMNTLYSADSAKDYDPLTSDEKSAMSDDEVEKWEEKIKSSLLRRDSTISSLLSSMRTTLNKSVEVTNADGTTSRYALSSFGIVTGTYTENGLLHIYGDSEDTDYMDYDDKLKAAIAANPEAILKTFTTLGSEMYTNLQKAMKKVDGVSSALTFYEDIQMDSEIQDYKDKVDELQDKLTAEQDRYYAQFSAMETALARLQSQQTYISQLFATS